VDGYLGYTGGRNNDSEKKVIENMRSKDLVIPVHDEFKTIRDSVFEMEGFAASKWYTS